MKKTKCRLCRKVGVKLTKHHVVPQRLIKDLNPHSDLINEIIILCEECHDKIHDNLLTHLIMKTEKTEFSEYGSVKYVLLKLFLKENNKELLKDWKLHLKELIRDCKKEMKKDKLIDEEGE